MRRRTLLKLGFAATAALAAGGTAFTWLRPGVVSGHLTEDGKIIFVAAARAILEGTLPIGAAELSAALLAHLDRLDQAIANFPLATRDELSQLLAVLATAPGRWLLCGLRPAWNQAELAEIQAALHGMRISRIAVRQQAYHALRDLTNAAYYGDSSVWRLLDYPGPQSL